MKIKNGAFSSCTYIRYAKLSENIDIINPFTFLHCYSLEKVIMPQNVNSPPPMLVKLAKRWGLRKKIGI